ncbi:selenocysteine-specific translation factor [Salmonella enterica subsp. enterica serovar Choleraesuis]|nr:selenocysteine-specific translation factor [Salmonella enterica subsp. enterica serovar Choleraesuis]
MIIATAGHVDHGKTTLLAALTGIDADRLPEEKKRGMTIDLGYAYWPQPDGRVVGFIDVPGHEKFLANMLAGVSGIDRALLVVACDDGVMAQTLEHLTILQLAGVPELSVALTKADRVDAGRLAEVEQQVRQVVTEMGWRDATLFHTSAQTGLGIAELQQHLLALSERPQRDGQRFRLAIDRAFSVKGAGLVVTGTAHSGEVSVGDTLWLSGADKPMRVRGLHAQNQPVERAHAGQRVALNLSGDAAKEDIQRGDWLLSARPEGAVERVLVELTAGQPFQQWQPVHLHHAASHITGRVSLLEGNLAELVLDTPLLLADNDRLIVRDISARQTLGAARVLLCNPPRRGKRQPAFLAWLARLAAGRDDAAALECWLERGSVSLADFGWARQLNQSGLDNLVAGEGRVRTDSRLLSETLACVWQDKILAVLAQYHTQHDDQPGPGRERLRRMALPAEDEPLVLLLIERLRQQGLLENHQGWLHLPGHRPGFTDAQQARWARVKELLVSEPWWVRDMARETGEEEQDIRQLMRAAAQQGLVTAIVKDRYYLQQRIVEFADLIRDLDGERGATNAADFRDRLGVGRKLAIQILEYFDRTGFTRRRGNDHLLRDSALFNRS